MLATIVVASGGSRVSVGSVVSVGVVIAYLCQGRSSNVFCFCDRLLGQGRSSRARCMFKGSRFSGFKVDGVDLAYVTP